jgi:hypothetical protein
MLAKELNCADLNHCVLLGHNASLELDIVLRVPFCSGCQKISVLCLNRLADYLKTNQMQLFRQLLSIEHLKEGTHNACKSEIPEGSFSMATGPFYDIADA